MCIELDPPGGISDDHTWFTLPPLPPGFDLDTTPSRWIPVLAYQTSPQWQDWLNLSADLSPPDSTKVNAVLWTQQMRQVKYMLDTCILVDYLIYRHIPLFISI